MKYIFFAVLFIHMNLNMKNFFIRDRELDTELNVEKHKSFGLDEGEDDTSIAGAVTNK